MKVDSCSAETTPCGVNSVSIDSCSLR
jgi:hypothetical protein